MFYSIMKSGKKITITDDNKTHTTATFYCDNDDVVFDNKEIGYHCVHDLFTADHEAFETHIKKMIEQGFTITIK